MCDLYDYMKEKTESSSILRILDRLYPPDGAGVTARISFKLPQPLVPYETLSPICSPLPINKLVTRHQKILPTAKGDARQVRKKQVAEQEKQGAQRSARARQETCPQYSLHRAA